VIAVLNQRGHPRGVSHKFVHADFYYIKDDDEIKDLKLENYLDDKNILFIEWGEKGGAFVDEIKKRAEIYLINIKYLSQIKREIKIGKLNK
jgi:tRNA A37 threonylcarbamoyladenosine biosynthesis protein TsaE